MGYQMTLSDLSPEMIQLAKERVTDLDLEERVDGFHVLDICDLHPLVDSSFDLVLALGGPLGLADDVTAGVAELQRVTKPGGYILCDVANRYRTGLELMRSGKPEQIMEVLASGEYARPDGLLDHRFDPEELHLAFQEAGYEVKRVVGICPFFEFLPGTDSVEVLENELMFEAMQDLSKRFAEEPAVVGLSGRLLIVAQRGA
jgi:SAM-dependent methyltransferase